jgi:hypothetical protein
VVGLLARNRDFPLFQTVWTFFGALLRAPSLELNNWCVSLTTCLHILMRLRMSGAVPLSPTMYLHVMHRVIFILTFTFNGLPYPFQLPPVFFKFGTLLIQDLCTGQINSERRISGPLFYLLTTGKCFNQTDV